MLGLLLQHQGLPFTIFERVSTNTNSDRGGLLDIHEDSGQLPLKEAGYLRLSVNILVMKVSI